jgi:hypothetical protein
MATPPALTLTYIRYPPETDSISPSQPSQPSQPGQPILSPSDEAIIQANIDHGALLNQGEIYCITNRITGERYVGKTKCMKKVNGVLVYKGYQDRFRQHLMRATSDNETTAQECGKFYGAIRYYGWDAFTVEMLERCDLSQINQRERYYIKEFKTRRKGYNMAKGGVPRKFLKRRGRGKK